MSLDADDRHWLHGIDLEDGTERWTTDAERETEVIGSAVGFAVDSGRAIWYHGAEGELVAQDGESGSVEWTVSIDGGPGPTFDKIDDAIYFQASQDGTHREGALDPSTGSELWAREIGGCCHGQPVPGGGFAYLNDGRNSIIEYDYSNEEERWEWDAPSTVNATVSPGEENVYFMSGDAYVYALHREV